MTEEITKVKRGQRPIRLTVAGTALQLAQGDPSGRIDERVKALYGM